MPSVIWSVFWHLHWEQTSCGGPYLQTYLCNQTTGKYSLESWDIIYTIKQKCQPTKESQTCRFEGTFPYNPILIHKHKRLRSTCVCTSSTILTNPDFVQHSGHDFQVGNGRNSPLKHPIFSIGCYCKNQLT